MWFVVILILRACLLFCLWNVANFWLEGRACLVGVEVVGVKMKLIVKSKYAAGLIDKS